MLLDEVGWFDEEDKIPCPFRINGIGHTFDSYSFGHYSVDVVFDGAFGGVGHEEVVVGEGVVVISSSLDMLTNSCLGGIMVSLIILEGLDEEALVEFMVEWCEEDEDDDRNEEDDLFN
nr:hypothetical protein [Tanacetum cinerariifolium]